MTTQNNPIDRLGALRAQIDALEDQETELRDAVIALGPGRHSGRFYRAYVIPGIRFTLPIDTAKAKITALLGARAAAKWFKRHTKQAPVTTVNVRCTTAHNLVPRQAA